MDKPAGATAPGEISEHALIGDCKTAALVDLQGSINWVCFPRFDSEACFAALLGDARNGSWRIAPTTPFKVSRRYRPGSLVLETLFETEDGVVALIDFMPTGQETSHIIRWVEGRRGRVEMKMNLALRFGYGLTVPWVTQLEDGALQAVAGPDMVILRTPIGLRRGGDMTTVGEFQVAKGQAVPFVLSHQASHLAPFAAIDPKAMLALTEGAWQDWTAKGRSNGPYAEAVERSLITLKALTYAPTGGLVAAPTTSLPEHIGGERNWDYRFCWIRDSTLSLLALMNGGYYEEAAAWRDWLHRAVAGDPADMQIMYGLAGERRLTEWTADWLPGFRDSAPVRIGNAAHEQFQLDVYGELMDTFHQSRTGGLQSTEDGWDIQVSLVAHVAKVWSEPDEGIWEVRGPRQHFTYSKVMAWVAIDRAIKGAVDFGLSGPVDDWRALLATIEADIWAKGFDPKLGRFKRSYEDASLDASLLLLAQVGFVDSRHPAYVATVEAIEEVLLIDGFVLRYQTAQGGDGLPPGEGAFLACSFWLADAYASLGRTADAKVLFDRLLSLRNDVGLLAEEYDSGLGKLVGNFPQAFSHIGLINTASNLTRSDKPIEQRSGVETGPPA